ncbi:DUF6191 domain-containing protein [Rhodococcus erythropolis]|uniref:DUF6191 domain-containing protein n=1 Tax=Rhodococcus erythropolis TaxID=1833 RepID=UPI0022A971CC|nr:MULTISPECIES: DUF6191 domain-containing protein [Rhodococcus erythropolis group]MCZ4527142.1 DUF6191 domain-containing protein [Rhodococcus erythropolis]
MHCGRSSTAGPDIKCPIDSCGNERRSSLNFFHGHSVREVAALFQGSKHHEFEQRQIALMHREDGTDGDPPWVSVDPEANKVVLRRRS